MLGINMFWQQLKKPNQPILVLAPMADVTDPAFRTVIAKYGKPDVMWTEFVSSDGLCLAPEDGRKKLLKDLEYSEIERPIVAQIFGSNPENMKKTAQLCRELGFDGIDINMGCPDRSIEKQKSGSAMMKYPDLAQEVIHAVMEGARSNNSTDKAGDLPVSVKTRLGYNQDELEEWLPKILETKPAVVTLHARTRKEMSKVPARWERIKRAVEIRDEFQKDLAPEDRTLIFGNGDVVTLEQAQEKYNETGCDGVMIGKGIFGKPWFFSGETPDLETRLKILIEHSELFSEILGHKSFAVMKKHFKAYIDGFPGAKELRMELMETEDAAGVRKIIEDFLDKSSI